MLLKLQGIMNIHRYQEFKELICILNVVIFC